MAITGPETIAQHQIFKKPSGNLKIKNVNLVL